MKSTIKWVDNVQFVAETGSGHAVVIDGAPEYGGRNTGVRPMELVLAGAASCTAFDVVLMLKKSRQNFTTLHVDADAVRAETDPNCHWPGQSLPAEISLAGPVIALWTQLDERQIVRLRMPPCHRRASPLSKPQPSGAPDGHPRAMRWLSRSPASVSPWRSMAH